MNVCRAGLLQYCICLETPALKIKLYMIKKSPAYEEIWSILIFLQDKMLNEFSEIAKAENE